MSWYKGNADRETSGRIVQCEGGTESVTSAAGRAWGFKMVDVEDQQVQVALGLAGGPIGLHWGRGGESSAWREQEVHAICCRRPCSLPKVVWGRPLVQWSIPRALHFQSIWRWLRAHDVSYIWSNSVSLDRYLLIYFNCLVEVMYTVSKSWFETSLFCGTECIKWLAFKKLVTCGLE